ncbi:MAG TPA: hypothetical protein VJ717_09400 [Gemmatimonadaceae bacterium]|nr:hypothetical protein [Gemmatimonadaceae bacterium]
MASNRSNKSGSSKNRESIEPRGSKRYARRDDEGKFTEQDDVSRSLRQDVRKAAKKNVPSGQGDRGDRRRS